MNGRIGGTDGNADGSDGTTAAADRGGFDAGDRVRATRRIRTGGPVGVDVPAGTAGRIASVVGRGDPGDDAYRVAFGDRPTATVPASAIEPAPGGGDGWVRDDAPAVAGFVARTDGVGAIVGWGSTRRDAARAVPARIPSGIVGVRPATRAAIDALDRDGSDARVAPTADGPRGRIVDAVPPSDPGDGPGSDDPAADRGDRRPFAAGDPVRATRPIDADGSGGVPAGARGFVADVPGVDFGPPTVPVRFAGDGGTVRWADPDAIGRIGAPGDDGDPIDPAAIEPGDVVRDADGRRYRVAVRNPFAPVSSARFAYRIDDAGRMIDGRDGDVPAGDAERIDPDVPGAESPIVRAFAAGERIRRIAVDPNATGRGVDRGGDSAV